MRLLCSPWSFAMTILLILLSQPLFAEPTHLTILHFNDLHGHVSEECGAKKCEGGLARLGTIVKEIKRENESKGWDTILLFGGDAFSGTLISGEFKGEAEFRLFEELGVDAAVAGNHEFDFTLPVFEERVSKASFPVLAANIKSRRTRKPILHPVSIITRPDGLTIGIVGLISEHTPHSTNPVKVADLSFVDPIKTANEYFPDIKNTDIQIALTHLGVDGDVKLAERTKGYDAIVGGHDHVRPNEYCREVKKIPVCQTPANGKYLGRLDIEIDGGRARFAGSELIRLAETTGPDPRIASIVAEYEKRVGTRYDEVIGYVKTNVPTVRGQASPMAAMIADAFRWYAGTDVALINSGGVRSSLKRGPVTLRKVVEILPFDNMLVALGLTGKELKELTSLSVKRGGGAYLQMSGAQELSDETTYTVATVDFLTAGGDGFTMLKSKETKDLGILARDVLADYIRAKFPTSSPSKAR